jgi:hypothetical protein
MFCGNLRRLPLNSLIALLVFRQLSRLAAAYKLKTRRTFQLAGFWILSASLLSGCPIGKLCRSDRYSDNNADYYDDVKEEPSCAQLRLPAGGHVIEREL